MPPRSRPGVGSPPNASPRVGRRPARGPPPTSSREGRSGSPGRIGLAGRIGAIVSLGRSSNGAAKAELELEDPGDAAPEDLPTLSMRSPAPLPTGPGSASFTVLLAVLTASPIVSFTPPPATLDAAWFGPASLEVVGTFASEGATSGAADSGAELGAAAAGSAAGGGAGVADGTTSAAGVDWTTLLATPAAVATVSSTGEESAARAGFASTADTAQPAAANPSRSRILRVRRRSDGDCPLGAKDSIYRVIRTFGYLRRPIGGKGDGHESGRMRRIAQKRAIPGVTGTSTSSGFDEPIAVFSASCSRSRPVTAFDDTP
jgi:hypothetical protein